MAPSRTSPFRAGFDGRAVTSFFMLQLVLSLKELGSPNLIPRSLRPSPFIIVQKPLYCKSLSAKTRSRFKVVAAFGRKPLNFRITSALEATLAYIFRVRSADF
jgi:hypothetical protein